MYLKHDIKVILNEIDFEKQYSLNVLGATIGQLDKTKIDRINLLKSERCKHSSSDIVVERSENVKPRKDYSDNIFSFSTTIYALQPINDGDELYAVCAVFLIADDISFSKHYSSVHTSKENAIKALNKFKKKMNKQNGSPEIWRVTETETSYEFVQIGDTYKVQAKVLKLHNNI